MENLKLLLPVLTFLLGSALTLYINRRSHRREVTKATVKEVCELTEAWYNEVVALLNALLEHLDKTTSYEKLHAYYNGSLFVSRYRRALETLRKFRSCRRFLELGDSFLSLLAEPRDVESLGLHMANMDIYLGGPEMLKCRRLEPIAKAERLANDLDAEQDVPCGSRARTRSLVPESPFLSKLYELVQAIHLEAARLARQDHL